MSVRPVASLKEGRGRIVVVEDEPRSRAALRSLLSSKGFHAQVVATPFKALGLLSEFAPHVVITDVRMPGMNGLRLLQEIRQRRPETMVIVMTGFACVRDAVRAVKLGAESYLEKPIDVPALLNAIDRAVVKARHMIEMRRLWTEQAGSDIASRIVGEHPGLERARQLIARVAATDVTVLLSGETGVGKGLVAEVIHEFSQRSAGPFVRFDCAAFGASSIESELFGHKPGSLSEAPAGSEGRLRQAHGGSLFLDEVSELPLPTQVKLLRFLQDKVFERVGGSETRTADVRVIAATQRDLDEALRAGGFRAALYYRLNVVHIDVPPLRERSSDIPLLAAAMLTRFARAHGKKLEGFSAEALELLRSHGWPGNVRELENAVERAVVLATGSTIAPSDLRSALLGVDGVSVEARIPGSTLAEIEREAILKTLEAVRGSTSKAARMLGISQRKIQYRLREYESAG